MATNFPSSLDNSSTIPVESATTKLSVNHVTAHQNIQDAIEAIEAKVGIDGSAVTTTHDYKLSEVTSTDKAVGKTATQTLTNKTLTSPVINLGSDAEGDTYYRNSSGQLTRLPRGTDNYILKMNGNVPNWEAEAVISNASLTTAGIVELATQSEVNAGTATGGTGAAVVVTPDVLSGSSPTLTGTNFSGIPATAVSGVSKPIAVQTTDVSLSSSSTETDIIANTSVPGGSLSSGRAIRVQMFVEILQANTSGDVTFRLYYGGSSIASITHVGTSITQYGAVEFIIAHNGTSAQYVSSRIQTGQSTGGTTNSERHLTASTTSAVNSGNAQNIKITVQGSAVNTPTTIKVYGAVIHLI